MSGRTFVDTNVLVYLFDGRDPDKQRVAGEVLAEISTSGEAICISTQVLQEAFVALTAKLHLDTEFARLQLEQTSDAGFEVLTVQPPIIWRAARRCGKDKLSFWDCLIIESALDSKCRVLLSEDLQHGQRFGTLQVINPFRQAITDSPRPTAK